MQCRQPELSLTRGNPKVNARHGPESDSVLFSRGGFGGLRTVDDAAFRCGLIQRPVAPIPQITSVCSRNARVPPGLQAGCDALKRRGPGRRMCTNR